MAFIYYELNYGFFVKEMNRNKFKALSLSVCRSAVLCHSHILSNTLTLDPIYREIGDRRKYAFCLSGYVKPHGI